MNLLIKFFFLFFILFSKNLYAEIYYINLDRIINQSEAGILINKKIDDLKKNNQKNIAKIKSELKEREDELVKQKNILNDEEFNKKLNNLKSDIDIFNRENKTILRDQNKISINYKTDLLRLIEPILLDYVSENNIKYLLQKKYIIVGHNDLNKTDEIINLVNKKIDISKINE